MSEEQLRMLDDLAGMGVVARYLRRSDPGAPRNGIVVSVSPEVVVLHTVDDNLDLDGHAALRPDELQTVEVAPYDQPVRKVLQERGQVPSAPPVPLDRWEALLRALVGLDAVVVHDVDPEVCWIGPIRCTESEVVVHCIAPDGDDADDVVLPFDRVTLVEWGTRYDQAVHIMSQTLSD